MKKMAAPEVRAALIAAREAQADRRSQKTEKEKDRRSNLRNYWVGGGCAVFCALIGAIVTLIIHFDKSRPTKEMSSPSPNSMSADVPDAVTKQTIADLAAALLKRDAENADLRKEIKESRAALAKREKDGGALAKKDKEIVDLRAAKAKLEEDQFDRKATIDTLSKQVKDLGAAKAKLEKDLDDRKAKLPQKAAPKVLKESSQKANPEFEDLRASIDREKRIAQQDIKKPNAAPPKSKQATPPRSNPAEESYVGYDTYVGTCHEVRGKVLTFWHHEGNGIGRAWESGRKCDSFTIASTCKFVVNGEPSNSVDPGWFIFVKAKGTVVYHCRTIPTVEEALSARAYASK